MFIQQIPLYIYEIQQNINLYLIQQINSITLLSFLTILTGGLLTSLSPCMASSIPIIISYVNTQKYSKSTKWILIAGISTSILVIGIIAIIIKKNILSQLHYFSIITTFFFIFIGMDLLKIISINFPSVALFNFKIKTVNNFIITYILGISIGLNISPCSTPIIAILITWISNTRNVLTGISLLIIYIIGYLSPIIACLISLSNFKLIQITEDLWYLLELITGVLLIYTGTFSLCNTIISFIFT